jgi:hypothetical protein
MACAPHGVTKAGPMLARIVEFLKVLFDRAMGSSVSKKESRNTMIMKARQ